MMRNVMVSPADTLISVGLNVSCPGVDLVFGLPKCDVQPLGFLPSCDDFGRYVVIGVADGTIAVVPIGPSPRVTVAHLVESVSVVITPIHERHRRCSNPAGWACRFENSSPQKWRTTPVQSWRVLSAETSEKAAPVHQLEKRSDIAERSNADEC